MSQIDDPEREDAQMIEEAMQNTLTPEAVAAIAGAVKRMVTVDANVNEQIQWFAHTLANIVGGWTEQRRMAEELNAHIG